MATLLLPAVLQQSGRWRRSRICHRFGFWHRRQGCGLPIQPKQDVDENDNQNGKKAFSLDIATRQLGNGECHSDCDAFRAKPAWTVAWLIRAIRFLERATGDDVALRFRRCSPTVRGRAGSNAASTASLK